MSSWGKQVIPNVAPGTRFKQIAAGYSHSLALKFDGTVVAWGDDYSGQITELGGLTGVVAIAAGEDHSLALKSDGTVVAWGYNYSGQVTVPGGLAGVVAIAAGYAHNLALVTSANQNITPAIGFRTARNNFVLSWPLTAQGFALQSTTNLTDKNSWTTMTNLPIIVDSQNNVTNLISSGPKFYRLKK